MIDISDKTLEWTKQADEDMGFSTMIDNYYKGKLLSVIEFKLHPYQPDFFYQWIYENHKDLILDIVEIFFPMQVFTPKNINKGGTNEYHLFHVINQICNIEWFMRIEESSYKGYEKKKSAYDAARQIIIRYAKEPIPYDFPSHKNEIITELKEYFKHINRVPQGQKIIDAIKDEFDIKRATQTNAQKIDKSIGKFLVKAGKTINNLLDKVEKNN